MKLALALNLPTMFMPAYLQKLADANRANKVWLESLPKKLTYLQKKWNLSLGEPFQEYVSCSYVVPCKMLGGKAAILKMGLPHEEALHEIDGLRLLDGRPTVKLLKFERESNAMLLEQCIPGTHLNKFPETLQDEVICDVLPKIWEALYREGDFRPLGNMVEQWNAETYDCLGQFPDPELAKEGCKVKEVLVASTQRHCLLATDLHAGNVLQAERQAWLAIDLKPYVGDPTYDLTQHLLNCKDRLKKNPRKLIERVAKLSGLNPARLEAWMFARLASEHKGKYQKLALNFTVN